jgi:putative glycosyltransferase (TIGR04372 family)
LEPLCLVFVAGFFHERLGPYLTGPLVLESRMRRLSARPAPLVIAAEPPAERCSNRFLTELWRRSGRFLITPAARSAYDILRVLKGQDWDNPAVNLPNMFSHVYVKTRGDGRSNCGSAWCRPKPQHARHLVNLRDAYWHVDFTRDLPPAAPPFEFTEEEQRRGADWVRNRVGREAYVTFSGHDPEQAYFDTRADTPREGLAGHSFRAVDPELCGPARRWLAGRGLASLWLGPRREAEGPLPAEAPGLANYAGAERDDFLDIHLPARAAFDVRPASGLATAPFVFNRPQLHLNTIFFFDLMAWVSGPRQFFTFKNLWSEKLGRFLSLRERLDDRVLYLMRTEDFERAGLRPVENTAEEILAATREMYSRFVAGDWEAGDGERRLRLKFDQLLERVFRKQFTFRGGLIYSFFQANPHLLDDA